VSWTLSGCRIVGGLCPVAGAAPFASAAVVLAREDGEPLLRVTRYEEPDLADGKLLAEEEWDGLVASEQGQRFPASIPAFPGARMWILRSNFRGRDAALERTRMSGALVHETLDQPGRVWTLVVDARRADPLRDDWAERAAREALRAAEEARWEDARDHGELAFVVDRSMVAEHVALLSVAYARLGRRERSEGYVAMARNSRGEGFAAEVERIREEIEAKVGPKAPRPRFAAEYARGSKRLMQSALRSLGAAARIEV
jgi:hypothetical protein